MTQIIPKNITGATRADLERIGFVFGADVDASFVQCELPPGWQKVTAPNGWHTDLVDELGRVRVGVDAKSGRSDVQMVRRYGISAKATGAGPLHYRVALLDKGEELALVGECEYGDRQEERRLEQAAQQQLTERFPDWRNPFAYWDVE